MDKPREVVSCCGCNNEDKVEATNDLFSGNSE